MTNTLSTVSADDVREGDFIPGLDNGYVVDVESDPNISAGTYGTNIGNGMVGLTFHTAEGDEAYLIVPPDMPITIQRGS